MCVCHSHRVTRNPRRAGAEHGIPTMISKTIRGDAVGQGKSEHDFRGVFALRRGGHASNISRMVGMPENYEGRLAATLW
jgi:hypothetical protein